MRNPDKEEYKVFNLSKPIPPIIKIDKKLLFDYDISKFEKILKDNVQNSIDPNAKVSINDQTAEFKSGSITR